MNKLKYVYMGAIYSVAITMILFFAGFIWLISTAKGSQAVNAGFIFYFLPYVLPFTALFGAIAGRVYGISNEHELDQHENK